MTFDQTGTQPREQLADTVRAALDAGVTLFDTADAYGPGDELGADAQGANERLIAGLLDELGVARPGAAGHQGRPRAHRRRRVGPRQQRRSTCTEAVDASLQRLGVEQIALWQHHRPDPEVDYDDVIGTLKRDPRLRQGPDGRPLQRRPRPDPRRRTRCSAGRWSACRTSSRPPFRSSRPEIDVCAELGLAFLPWSPLGGLGDAKELAEKHPAFAEVAAARGVSAQQVALAWELAQSPVVIPIPGAKRPAVDHSTRRRPPTSS